jgi:hypothetical protein
VAGTDFDQIILSGGSLLLGASANLEMRFTGSASEPNFDDLFWYFPHTWRIALLDGGSNPGFSNFGRIGNATYAAGRFTTTADGSGILLTYTPSTQPVAMPPRMTTVVLDVSGRVTVYYMNTFPGTNYVLSYSTNLTSPNWFIVGSKTATAWDDSQTDNSATGDQRFYRVYYVTP